MDTSLSSNWFVKIKDVDNKKKLIVMGYIRIYQNLFENNNTYYNIPSLVQYLCIAYYWIAEYFTIHGDNINLIK